MLKQIVGMLILPPAAGWTYHSSNWSVQTFVRRKHNKQKKDGNSKFFFYSSLC